MSKKQNKKTQVQTNDDLPLLVSHVCLFLYCHSAPALAALVKKRGFQAKIAPGAAALSFHALTLLKSRTAKEDETS